MKWISQFSLVMRSSITSLREKIEDPERMLHQLLIDMQEELDRVRCSVAEAVADEIQMRRRLQRETEETERWKQRAEQAVQRGDEQAARVALKQSIRASERQERLAAEHLQQQQQVSRLQAAVQDLEDKIQKARHKKTLLAARMARTCATRKINDALERTHSQSAFSQFSRMEERVEREEAMTEAWERLQGHDTDAEDIDRRFAEEDERRLIDEQLQTLKQKVADRPGDAMP